MEIAGYGILIRQNTGIARHCIWATDILALLFLGGLRKKSLPYQRKVCGQEDLLMVTGKGQE